MFAPYTGPWTFDEAAHLLRRTIFGPTKAINKRYHRSGSLFRGKTKVKDGWVEGWITLNGPNKQYFFQDDNDYARWCFQYIHNNPVKAKLVNHTTDWTYSSGQDYAGLRNGTLCNQELARKVLTL